MMGHERIGMKLYAFSGKRVAQPVQIALVIRFAKETSLTVVTALHDVQRQTIEVNAGAARRRRSLSLIN